MLSLSKSTRIACFDDEAPRELRSRESRTAKVWGFAGIPWDQKERALARTCRLFQDQS